ncbi:MAG: type transporter [Frankiales bacterium]|nr:type transporter [Frankiales bacterium]
MGAHQTINPPEGWHVSAGLPAAASPLVARQRADAQRRVRWELLAELVRKDLKVKYQGSVLGFAWSLANPLLLMAIYYLVFAVVLRNGIPGFAIFIVAGLLPWTAFSGAVMTGTTSVVANSGLVKKVRFPLQVLPLSAVGYAMMHFALQLGAVLVITAAFRHVYSPAFLLILPAIALMVLFATSLSYIAAALNVRYRDTAHVVEIALLVWFWLNPVLYPASLVQQRLHGWYWAYFLNPMATVVTSFQRAIFVKDAYTNKITHLPGHALADPGYVFYLRNLAMGFAISIVLMVLARRLFRRMQVDFAEEL